ncbi:MAG: nitroreductase family deazaflavin-dependent oxidoreductase [Actinophytocola sp.]|uniref:nitroreductase family deazaflavin-dependent oxidoreductase n=1 Tax=Actinophytocola sp. TaxID=1872138 RepID=UPI003D6A9F82
MTGANFADSWLDVKGNGYLVADNHGSTALRDGFQTHVAVEGWGRDNTFRHNTADVRGPGYGVQHRAVRRERAGQRGVLGQHRDERRVGSGQRAHDGLLRLTCAMPLKGEYEPSASERSRNQVAEFEASDGARGNTLRGMPVIILTTVGAKSGKIRKTPLMRVESEGRYAVVASLGGAPKHPVWYHNVKANPHVELQDGAVRQDMLAREVTGAEKADWWETAVEAYPDYADYQRKTDRDIPVFVLEPADG